jgi:pilus assembly protein CpaC
MPISPNQVQISAKRTGVTQVNLWGEDKRIYTVDVIVTGDVAELTQTLRESFPKTALTITAFNGDSVIISGYVDQQDEVPKILAIANSFFPGGQAGASSKVINNMIVSGVQQAVLHVKVYEVSRSKMRNMGFDWASIGSDGNHMMMSGVSGLLTTAAGGGMSGVFGPPSNGADNAFKVQAGSFYAVLGALRQDSLAKLDSEPNLITISGRPAYLLVGGVLNYQMTSGLTGPTTGSMEYGTRLDFVPIVLGNGRMHIDIRSKVSEPDPTNSSGGIPSLTTREVETGVELRAGQTLAIAGLIEHRSEATNGGLPWISEIPYLGAAFRTVSHQTNEIELLVLVTPEIVDGMNPGQVPACMPGMESADPSDWDLFFKGHLEVPNCCAVEPAVSRVPLVVAGGAGSNPAASPNNPQVPQNPTAANQMAMQTQPAEPGFIGPVGYDVLK